MLLFDIFDRGKTRGGAGYKVNVMKLKFYRVFWISDHGRDNQSCKMQILNCIDNLERCFIDLNCIEIIYNLDKIYPIGVFLFAHTCDYVQW